MSNTLYCEAAIQYLQQENYIEKIQESWTAYLENYCSSTIQHRLPYRILLTVDVMKLCDISEKLVDLFIREAEAASKVFQWAVYQIMSQMTPVNTIYIDIVIKLVSFPGLMELVTDKPRTNIHNGLFLLKGVLTAKRNIAKYVRSSGYRCSSDSCPNNGNIMRATFSEKRKVKCIGCGSSNDVTEVPQSRDVGDKVYVVICGLQYLVPSCLKNGVGQGVIVLIKDEIMEDMLLGEEYIMCVERCIHTALNGQQVYNAWNVERKLPTVRKSIGILQNVMMKDPSCINDTYNTNINSPWLFIYKLASQLATDVFPPMSFLHLKVGLLLSLASQRNCETKIHILGLGSESGILMEKVSALVARKVNYNGCTSGGHVKTDNEGYTWVEAGPCTLARNGIFFIGDWSKFLKGKLTIKRQILTTIENQMCRLQYDDQLTEMNSFIQPPNLACSIWTYWSNGFLKNNEQENLRTLIDVFGMPFFADSPAGADDSTVTKHILSPTGFQNNISMEDMVQYLEEISVLKVTMPEYVAKLIQSYFVANRRARSKSIPLSSVKNMMTLAEAHARLSLRDEVTYEDALHIIFLYEQSLVYLYGYDASSPPIFITLTSCQDAFFENVNNQIAQFQKWLQRFINDHVTDRSW